MALNNDLNNKAGLDTVTQEEHEDITFTFAALADPEAASDSASVLADAADFDSSNLTNNVFYINLSPNTESLNDYWRQRLKAATENVDMSSGFFNEKASRTLNDVLAGGQISPKDEIKKASYFAKETNFVTKKEDLHKALISHFTQGLNLPNNVLDKFEGFLANVQNTIKNSPTPSREGITIYIYAVIYVKDEMIQQWQPYIRTISFKASQSLSTYVKDKNSQSTGSQVNVDFQYVQFDGSFNNDLFERSAKPALMQVQRGGTTIKPLNITFDGN
ncbi:uncharacterized protein FTJAE_5497 [Fusarium tjaetaba]|uniref:Uncharacterized protein n=1 Tax=Fusarium tjaetaba TaxID=1567544 RepID=A0A8H5VX46_9HYPO|nr:uncharacterized protein FTJAE_5497 [Fusarium tjaetaba]KAF5637640.1 hypothetical protein FTJAE_5497 [Fusarium tjaetaba]